MNAVERARRRVGRIAVSLLDAGEGGFSDPVHVYHISGPYWMSVERSRLKALIEAASDLRGEEWWERKRKRDAKKKGGA